MHQILTPMDGEADVKVECPGCGGVPMTDRLLYFPQNDDAVLSLNKIFFLLNREVLFSRSTAVKIKPLILSTAPSLPSAPCRKVLWLKFKEG